MSCSRKYTDKVVEDAQRWWGREGAPIALSDFSNSCDVFQPEEEERICRLIKHHGGEIVLNPTGDGEQVIIDFDDIMELIRAAKRQERADILLDEEQQ